MPGRRWLGSRGHSLRLFVVGLAALVVAGGALAQGALATPSLAASSYRTTAQCWQFAESSGPDSRRAAVASGVCVVLDSFGRMIANRVVAAALTSPFASSLPAAAYPLKVSGNGRYLVDQNDAPFLMVGDSPQAMVGNIPTPDAEFFLANRQKYGFNTVWVNLVCNDYTGCHPDGTTFDGVAPFTTPGDLSTPNEAYFSRADQVISLAARYGMAVLLDPIETGGWTKVMRANGTEKAYNFGLYVGQRYSGYPNIVWMSGNDFQTWTDADDDAVALAVAQGIKNSDPNHIHTLELNWPISSSRDDPNWARINQLDAAYTYQPTYAEVLKDYNRDSVMPVFMVEANYEWEHHFTGPETLRRQEYWSLLSGATGQLYGNKYTWPFVPGWKDHLDTIGSAQMSYVTNLFGPRRWYDLVPDQDHSLVTAGYGTPTPTGTVNDTDYLTAASTADGSLAIAYAPTGRSVTVDLSKLSGSAQARWYDPSSGSLSTVAGAPFANTGAQSFQTPGKNADGDGDWVLVLEATPQP